MSEPTKYSQVPYVVQTIRTESSDGRVGWYHTLSDGRIVGHWAVRDVETGVAVASRWVEVAPAIPDAVLEGGK
jgi:hypothetical protein